MTTTHKNALRVAAALWLVWGLVHLGAGIITLASTTTEAVQAIEDAKGAVQVFFPVQIEIRAVSSETTADTAGDGTATEALASEMARELDPD